MRIWWPRPSFDPEAQVSELLAVDCAGPCQCQPPDYEASRSSSRPRAWVISLGRAPPTGLGWWSVARSGLISGGPRLHVNAVGGTPSSQGWRNVSRQTAC